MREKILDGKDVAETREWMKQPHLLRIHLQKIGEIAVLKMFICH